MGKDYVGMDMCLYCGEAKGIILDKRMKATLEKEQVTSLEPCDCCKEKYKDYLIVVENVEGEVTGRWCAVSKNVVSEEFKERPIAFADREVMEDLRRRYEEYNTEPSEG